MIQKYNVGVKDGEIYYQKLKEHTERDLDNVSLVEYMNEKNNGRRLLFRFRDNQGHVVLTLPQIAYAGEVMGDLILDKSELLSRLKSRKESEKYDRLTDVTTGEVEDLYKVCKSLKDGFEKKNPNNLSFYKYIDGIKSAEEEAAARKAAEEEATAERTAEEEATAERTAEEEAAAERTAEEEAAAKRTANTDDRYVEKLKQVNARYLQEIRRKIDHFRAPGVYDLSVKKEKIEFISRELKVVIGQLDLMLQDNGTLNWWKTFESKLRDKITYKRGTKPKEAEQLKQNLEHLKSVMNIITESSNLERNAPAAFVEHPKLWYALEAVIEELKEETNKIMKIV